MKLSHMGDLFVNYLKTAVLQQPKSMSAWAQNTYSAAFHPRKASRFKIGGLRF
jgi:hypothetical protein